MVILVRFIGIMMAVIGIAVILNPNLPRAAMNFIRQGKRVYWAGIGRLIIGTFFVLVAPRCRLPVVIAVLGALMILSGIAVFVIGPKRIQAMFNWLVKRPPSALRVMGLAALTIGTLVLYSV